jgi:Uma2 family endonuclease
MPAVVPSTALDIYRMLPEGTRCEVLYNQLSMSPSPSTEHQLVSFKLSGILFVFLEKSKIGIAFAAPTDVYFEEDQSVVQPDLLVILNENKHIIEKDGIHGAPDVIFEILSVNRKHDTLKKKTLYEKTGVKEYFIIDPSDNSVTLFAFNGSNLYEMIYEGKGRILSDILGCDLQL